MKNKFNLSNAFFLLMLAGTGCSPHQKEAEKLPNVIFILADDLGYSELNCFGNHFNETPNIDRLAENGLRFTNAYASAPVCSPFRASLMTGQHPARIGITDYLRPHEDVHLSEDLTTIADIFRSKGYQIGMIGKWHLSGYAKNGAKESGPEKHGFNEVILTEKRGISGGCYFYPYHFNQEVKQRIFPVEHLTDRENLEALDYIERNNPQKTGNPFFLYKSHYSVHTNLNGKHEYVEYFSKKKGAGLSPLSNKNNVHLAAQLKSIDDGVGLILNKLEEIGQLENTLIVFMSDNGGETNVTTNAPLRAGKSSVYEGGIRVPMIVYWPEKIKQPSVVDQPVSNMDFFSTFSGITGYDLSKAQVQDGKSMLEIWENPESAKLVHESLIWHYPLTAPHFLGGFSGGAIRKNNYKLVEDFTSKKAFLFDIQEDIGEQKDLSEELPEVKKEMVENIDQWRNSLSLKASGYTKERKPMPDYPDPYGPEINLDINGNVVPWMNYGVTLTDDKSLVFGGQGNFIKLLHLYIPDVTAKSVELSGKVQSKCDNGVIIAHGEEVFGLSVYLKDGKLYFSTRKYGVLTSLKTTEKVNPNFTFKANLLKNGDMNLFVDGKLVESTNIGESLPIPPDDPISIGSDFRRLIGEYDADNYFTGTISDVKFIVE